MSVVIRDYEPADAVPTWEVFHAAVRRTAVRDYGEAAVAAWAPQDPDLERWAARRAAARTVVAVDDGSVVGFSDLTEAGVLDMLFVDPDHTGRGVARALVAHVLDEARGLGLTRVSTRASLTARPVFERLGFVVDAELDGCLRGQRLASYGMHRDL